LRKGPERSKVSLGIAAHRNRDVPDELGLSETWSIEPPAPFPEGEMIFAVSEMEEEGEGFLTVEERLYRVENQLASLLRAVCELTSMVGVANSYIIMESEGSQSARIISEAKRNAADVGDLLQTVHDRMADSS
jgi:hypothetical protein